MKKLVRLMSLLLVLLMAVCVFVACNDTPDDVPDDPDNPDVPDVPDDPTAKLTVTFKFETKDGVKLADDLTLENIVYGSEVTPPKAYTTITKFPDHVIEGWDTDNDGKIDEGYKSVKKNMTIKAIFRDKKTFTVKFYGGENGVVSCELPVKEGEAVDMSKVNYPSTVGRIFKEWVNADPSEGSTLKLIRSDASFVAKYAKLDSVIPMVAKNTITIDGVKDEAYKSGAYLPINEERHADRATSTYTSQLPRRPENNGSAIEGDTLYGTTSPSWITADAWLVWDGDYIYVLVEVSDKTLSYRNPTYVTTSANAWLNDSVECYFNFEQSSDGTTNNKKLGIDALGQKMFANTIADAGWNSTHFPEMAAAARSALGTFQNGSKRDYNNVTDGVLTNVVDDLKDTDDAKVQYENAAKNYSYRVEFKFVAKTEGKPDVENFPNVEKNGRLPEGHVITDVPKTDPNYGKTVPALENKNDPIENSLVYYRFTEGEALGAGSSVRFNLQITDLMITKNLLEDSASGYYEGDQGEWQAAGSKVFKTAHDDSSKFFPPFVPVGHTQYDMNYYVAFSLGGEGDAAKWEVYELKGNGPTDQKMYGADGKEISQGSVIETVKVTAE